MNIDHIQTRADACFFQRFGDVHRNVPTGAFERTRYRYRAVFGLAFGFGGVDVTRKGNVPIVLCLCLQAYADLTQNAVFFHGDLDLRANSRSTAVAVYRGTVGGNVLHKGDPAPHGLRCTFAPLGLHQKLERYLPATANNSAARNGLAYEHLTLRRDDTQVAPLGVAQDLVSKL